VAEARRLRREGASALVQISNEAWFGPTSMPRQMLAEAVFRAVENNVDVIRATNSGLSAFIHPTGQTEGETPTFETATRTWQVKTADEAQAEGLTFYTRHGDVFAVACAILSVLAVGASFIPERKSDEI
jgi:apolipoprotein N-acyltransferase